MMHKPKLLLLLAWVQVVIANGQIQQKRWYQFKPNSIVTNAINHPTSGPVLAEVIHSTSFPNYKGYNAAWDKSGQLIFYAISSDGRAAIFDKLGNVKLELFEPNGIKEIPIIKLGCGEKYHIILNGKICEYDVMEDLCYLVTPAGSPINVPSVNFGSNQNTQTFGVSIGVTKISDFAYNIYTIEANQVGQFTRKIQHHTISFDGSLWSGLQSVSTANISTIPINGNTVGTTILGTNAVLEISPNKQFVAVATDREIIVHNLLPNGNLGSLKHAFSIGATSLDDTYKIAGLEFTNDNKLVFSRFKWQTGVPAEPNAVGVVDLTLATPTLNYISGTADYSRSEIELASDGKLYITSATQLAEVNAANLTVTNKLAAAFYLNTEFSNANEDYRVRTLPDQIDGMDNSDGFSLTADVYTTNGNSVWSPTSNPFGVVPGASLFIGESINIQHDLTIENMTIEFSSNARIFISVGGKLTLKGCTLKSMACAKMWEGIRVQGSSTLEINPNMPVSVANQTTIRDAKIAINAGGSLLCSVNINNTNFIANGMHIRASSMTSSNLTCLNSQFSHSQLLLNQDATSGGVLFNGNWYGGTHVLIAHTRSATPALFQNNQFVDGSLGVRIDLSNARFIGNRFSQMAARKAIAIQATQNGLASQTEIFIDTNSFSDVNKALDANRCVQITFTRNTVLNTANSAVDIYNSRNCNLVITHNTFTWCRNNAIILNNNAGANSRAFIHRNRINGFGNSPTIPNTGITVSEQAQLTAGNTYGKATGTFEERGLKITENTMRNMGFGIRLNNIRGEQINDADPINQSAINGNNIEYGARATGSTANNTGIQVMASRGITVFADTVYRTSRGNFLNPATPNTAIANRGISIEGTLNTLVRNNGVIAGRGLAANGFCQGNNYTCNTFTDNVTSISLDNHFLRNTGQTHGIPNTLPDDESRQNYFIANLSGAHIQLNIIDGPAADRPRRMANNIRNNKWVVSGLPSIVYNPMPNNGTNIIAGFGRNLCPVIGRDVTNPTGGVGLPPADLQADFAGIYWQWMYEHERELRQMGETNNAFMASLIQIENAMANDEWGYAQQLITGLTTEQVQGQNYLQVFRIAIATQLPEYRELTQEEINTLTQIANQMPEVGGHGVYIARGILWHRLGLDFYTGVEYIQPTMLQVELGCMDSLPANYSAVALNTEGYAIPSLPVVLDQSGYVYIPSYALQSNELDTLQEIAFEININGSTFTSNYHLLYKWIQGVDESIDICSFGKTSNNDIAQEENTPLQATIMSQKVSIYPNPANHTVSIAGGQGAQVSITSITGQQVWSSTLTNNTFSVGNLPNGLYIVTVQLANGNRSTHRLAIQH